MKPAALAVASSHSTLRSLANAGSSPVLTSAPATSRPTAEHGGEGQPGRRRDMPPDLMQRHADRRGGEDRSEVAESLGDQGHPSRWLKVRSSLLGRLDPACLIGVDKTGRRPLLQLLAQQRGSG